MVGLGVVRLSAADDPPPGLPGPLGRIHSLRRGTAGFLRRPDSRGGLPMPRVARHRQWTEAACYHLLNRGHNRDTVFADETDFGYFLQLLARYRDRLGLRLYHYRLMGNHFHLLLQLPDPRQLSAFVAGLLRAYVHHAHRRTGFVGHLFQGRFKSPAIEAQRYLLSCGRYVERNPLAARLVAVPWD